MILIDIGDEADAWTAMPTAHAIISKAAHATLNTLGFDTAETELSVLLTDDEHMAQINGQWRAKPMATNVLSFPAMQIAAGNPPGAMLGDIVLAFQTIEREAAERAKTMDDHLFHLVVHGTLHLVGYDHEVDSEAETMEKLEIDILAAHMIANPYIDEQP
jgi:probable rRNA maturation factor